MAGWKKLTYGKTITGGKPGERIKACVDELQEKVVTDIVSAVPGYEFAPVGDNTMEMRVATDTEGNSDRNDLVQKGNVEMGSVGDLRVRKSKGSYIIDIVFPKGPEATSGGGWEEGDIPTGGESPYITTAPLTGTPGGTRVTIHNPDGTTPFFDVMNGSNGRNGTDGLITDLDDNSAIVTCLDPQGGHELKIDSGELKLILKTATYGIDVTSGKLSLKQIAQSSIEIAGPSIATCIAYNGGST